MTDDDPGCDSLLLSMPRQEGKSTLARFIAEVVKAERLLYGLTNAEVAALPAKAVTAMWVLQRACRSLGYQVSPGDCPGCGSEALAERGPDGTCTDSWHDRVTS